MFFLEYRQIYKITIVLMVSFIFAALPFTGTSRSEESGFIRTDTVSLPANPSFKDYISFIENNNPGLDAARERIKASSEHIEIARSLPDPILSYSYDNMSRGSRHQVGISQMFPWSGKRGLMEQSARIGTEMKDNEYENLFLQLYSEFTRIYAEYYFLSRELAITEDSKKIVSYIGNVARAQYAGGRISQSPVVRAQVELGLIEEQFQSLQLRKRPLEAALKALLGISSETELPFPEQLPEPSLEFNEDGLAELVFENNPELSVRKLEVERMKREVALARKEFYPDIMAGVYMGRENGNMGADNSVMGMITINLPVRRSKNRAALSQAEALTRSAENEVKEFENQLRSELADMIAMYRDSERKVALYRDSLLPVSKQSLAVTQTAFETGQADFLELMDSLRTLIQVELAQERAQADLLINHSRIAFLAGTRDFIN